MKKSRQHLIKIIEILPYLGLQGLVLRGNQSNDISNFMQLLKSRIKEVFKLNQWFDKNRKMHFRWYLKPGSHHNCTSYLRKLAENWGSFYALICDKYNNISSK